METAGTLHSRARVASDDSANVGLWIDTGELKVDTDSWIVLFFPGSSYKTAANNEWSCSLPGAHGIQLHRKEPHLTSPEVSQMKEFNSGEIVITCKEDIQVATLMFSFKHYRWTMRGRRKPRTTPRRSHT